MLRKFYCSSPICLVYFLLFDLRLRLLKPALFSFEHQLSQRWSKTSKGTMNKLLKGKKIYLGSHRFLFSLIYGYAIQWVIAECNGQWLADLVCLIPQYHCLRFLRKPEKNRKWEESIGWTKIRNVASIFKLWYLTLYF